MTLAVIAIFGALVCVSELVVWFSRGAWPLYDTACFWQGGRHLLEGRPVYGEIDGALPFRYAPPWAVVWAVLSLLPLDVLVAGLLILQVLALRYVAGSWRNAGLLCWLPIVPGALATGNVDFLIAATILGALRGVSRSGWAVTWFAMAKLSPAAVLVMASRHQWRDAIVAGIVLCALTIPFLHLWPEWIAYLQSPPGNIWLPLLPRIPVGLALLAYRKPWSVAAGAAVLTPAFYAHSLVLLIPALRLGWPSVMVNWRRLRSRRQITMRITSPRSRPAGS